MVAFFQIILAILIGWLFCYILTVTNVFPTDPDAYGYNARTDINTEVLREAAWFDFPYPGKVRIISHPVHRDESSIDILLKIPCPFFPPPLVTVWLTFSTTKQTCPLYWPLILFSLLTPHPLHNLQLKFRRETFWRTTNPRSKIPLIPRHLSMIKTTLTTTATVIATIAFTVHSLTPPKEWHCGRDIWACQWIIILFDIKIYEGATELRFYNVCLMLVEWFH